MLPGFIGHGHRPFYPPTEAKGLRQENGDIAPLQRVIILTNFLDQVALILRIHHAHHLGAMTKAFAMVIVGMVQRPFKRFGIHRKTRTSPVLCLPIVGGEAQSDAKQMGRKIDQQKIIACNA